MFLEAITQIKLFKFSFRKLFLLSFLTYGLINKSNVIPQPIDNQNLDEGSKISNLLWINFDCDRKVGKRCSSYAVLLCPVILAGRNNRKGRDNSISFSVL